CVFRSSICFSVVVIVSKMPVIARFYALLASPAVDVACFDYWFPLGSQSLVCVSVASLGCCASSLLLCPSMFGAVWCVSLDDGWAAWCCADLVVGHGCHL